MFKPNIRNIETLKNILIVVLFFTTVLLLCFFWKNDAIHIFKMPIDIITTDTETKVPEVSKMIQPERVMIGFGKTGSYTVLNDNNSLLWTRAVSAIADISNSENLLVEEITPGQYKQVMELRSIQFYFSYDIPFSEFMISNGIKKFQALDNIGGMSVLAYSEGSGESLFIYEKEDDKYYRIVSNRKSFDGFSSMIDETEAAGYATYYPSSKYFGVETEDMVLLPLALQSNLEEVPYTGEVSNNNSENILDLAESFFGESFDFVRRMTDNKNRIIYMYGYGQKVFTVNADGIFEYKEEPDDSSSIQMGFYESLKASLAFISVHGTWDSLDGTKLSPYLKDVQVIERDKKKGYHFVFGMKLDGYEIQYEKGESMEIDILGSQIVSYKRNMVDFSTSTMSQLGNSAMTDVFPAVNVPAVNYEYIIALYKDRKKGHGEQPADPPDVQSSTEESFENLAEEIVNMRPAYVRLRDQEQQILKPVWILSMDGLQVYFGLYDAQPVGYTYTN